MRATKKTKTCANSKLRRKSSWPIVDVWRSMNMMKEIKPAGVRH
jgi:hypothetical protein